MFSGKAVWIVNEAIKIKINLIEIKNRNPDKLKHHIRKKIDMFTFFNIKYFVVCNIIINFAS